MGSIAGPPPVVLWLGRDRYVVPCACGHEYNEHQRYGSHCKGVDSYQCPCECPSYEADENNFFTS